jgi:thiol-disulfide isomerase/thioredoxin
MRKFFFLFLIVGCIPAKEKHEYNYTPFSSSVIHLSFPKDLSDTILVDATSFTNIPAGRNETRKQSVVRSGEYYLDIEVDRPAKSFLNLGNKQYNIFIFPGDTTHITITPNDDEFDLTFQGRAKELNQYYLEKKKTLGYTDIRFPLNKSLSSWSTYDSLKANADSLVSHELSFLRKYISSAELPSWFIDYENAEIIYAGAGYKTYLPGANQVQKYFSDSLPNNYYDFLDEVVVNNPKATLSSYYFWFLNDYFNKDLALTELKKLNGFEFASKYNANALALSKKTLSGHTRQLYHKHLFGNLIQYYSDSLEIDSLVAAFEVTDYKELANLANIRSRNEFQALNINKGDTIPDFFLVDQLDSLVSIRTFQNQVLYVNFWATWCGPCIANIPNLNKLIDQYAQNPRIQFVNICLDSEKPKWLISIDRHKLMGVNLYAENNWNAKLRSNFNIKGIPHYMIINPGNVMLENFSSSAPDVKAKLDAALAVRQEQL